MSLAELDQINTEVVELLYQTVPFDDWIEARMTFRISPESKAAASRFRYVRADRSIDRSSSPASDIDWKLYRLLTKQREVSVATGQPWWLQIFVVVTREGSFRMEFEYKDPQSFRDEDLSLPDLPPLAVPDIAGEARLQY